MPRAKTEVEEETIEEAVERVKKAAVDLEQPVAPAPTVCNCDDSDILTLKCRVEKASLVIGWMLNHGRFDEPLTAERMAEFEGAARVAAGMK